MIIGVDPGKTGAIAAVTNGKLRLWSMPTVDGFCELIQELSEECHNRADFRVVVEKVSAGGVANKEGRRMGATSAFTFGRGFGELLGSLCALKVCHELVSPQRWTAAMSLRGVDKNKHLSAARRLYPVCELNGNVKPKSITKYGCDAVLLAEYGRRFLWTEEVAKS